MFMLKVKVLFTVFDSLSFTIHIQASELVTNKYSWKIMSKLQTVEQISGKFLHFT